MFSGGMVKTVGSFFRQRNIDLDTGALAGHRLNIKDTVDKFGAIPQVDHAQAAALVIGAGDRGHVEADPVILDLEQGQTLVV